MTIQRAQVLDLIMTPGQFQDDPKYMLLLGAGASASSGVPLATDLVIELLRIAYWAKKKVLSGDARVQPEAKIRAWARKALPWFDPSDAERSEYEQAMTNVLRLPDARNEFLRRKLAKAKPSKGYQRLGALISRGVFTTIWTTNFDHLVRACTRHLLEPIEEVNSSDQFSTLDVSSTRRRLIRLHGDFWHGDLVNTPEEFRRVPAVRYKALRRLLLSQGLIVVGYGGRDREIMNTLIKAAREPNVLHQGLFWCIRKNETVPPLVQNLFEVCNQRAYLVEIDGFDQLIAEVERSSRRDSVTRSSSVIATSDDSGFAWEGQALLAELAEALTSDCSTDQVRQRQNKTLSHLCKMLGASKAAIACRRSRGSALYVNIMVDLLGNSDADWEGHRLDTRSELAGAIANGREPYLRFGPRKAGRDRFFSALSGGDPIHTISVPMANEVRGFVSFALKTPLENAPIEFRILKAAAQLLVALSSMTLRR